MVLAALAGAGACGGGIDATYRWKPGESRTYRRTMEIRGTTPGAGEVRVLSAITTRETALESIPRAGTTLDTTFQRIRSEVDLPGGERTLTFDTGDGPSEPGADPAVQARFDLFRNMIGARLLVTVSPGGRIDGIEGTEELRETLLRGLPPGEAVEAMARGITNPFALHHQLRNLLVVPEVPLEKDRVWQFRDIQPLPPETTGVPAQLYLMGTARVASVADGSVRIEFEGEVSLDPYPGMDPPRRGLGEGNRRYRLEEGRFRGHGVVDTAAGLLREAEHETRLQLHLLKPDGTASIPVPMTLTQRMEIVE